MRARFRARAAASCAAAQPRTAPTVACVGLVAASPAVSRVAVTASCQWPSASCNRVSALQIRAIALAPGPAARRIGGVAQLFRGNPHRVALLARAVLERGASLEKRCDGGARGACRPTPAPTRAPGPARRNAGVAQSAPMASSSRWKRSERTASRAALRACAPIARRCCGASRVQPASRRADRGRAASASGGRVSRGEHIPVACRAEEPGEPPRSRPRPARRTRGRRSSRSATGTSAAGGCRCASGAPIRDRRRRRDRRHWRRSDAQASCTIERSASSAGPSGANAA